MSVMLQTGGRGGMARSLYMTAKRSASEGKVVRPPAGLDDPIRFVEAISTVPGDLALRAGSQCSARAIHHWRVQTLGNLGFLQGVHGRLRIPAKMKDVPDV